VAVVRGIYEAFGRSGPQIVLVYLHPEVGVRQSGRLPWSGHYEGTRVWGEFLGELTRVIETDVDPDEFVGCTRSKVRQTIVRA
jgi:hypothetical protein